jgi:hypothetical protein
MTRSSKLENIYHKSQSKIWDGREVLSSLIEKHDGISVDDDKSDALSHERFC